MQILTGLGIGGLENVVIELVSNLDRSRYEPIVCSLDRNEVQAHRLEEVGIRVIYMNRKPGIDYLLPIRLARVLREEKIQLIHTHNATCYFYGILAAILAGVPIRIHTEHGRIFPDKKIIMGINKFLSLKVDKIVTVSEKLRQQLNRYEHINARRIETIPNGIDPKIFDQIGANKEMSKERFGFSPKDKLIGIVARLYPVKNHKCLFGAFSSIVRERPDTKLLVIGDGLLKKPLEGLAWDLNISERVFFLGNRSDVPELLSILDIFVLPSKSEGISLTLIEAMAASLPVVATNVGGNPELVKDGVNGFLVSPDNPKVLADAIFELLNDSQKARQMGIFGRAIFERRFTIDKMVTNYENIYEHFISRKLQKNGRASSFRCNSYVKQPEGKNFIPGKLGGYYNDLSNKIDLNNRFPLINYGKKIGTQEKAVAVTQMALGCYEVWLVNKDKRYKNRFLELADWLVNKQYIGDKGGVWKFNFDWAYGLKSPWISAMAQGEGISVLLRAHQITQEKRYLLAAQAALKLFKISVEEGGVKSFDEEGNIFFEEYPSMPYSHILNGFIFALWGLYDYAIYQNDIEARQLFEKGINSLEKYLEKYDLGYWSIYDLYKPYRIKNIANYFYHQLHIAQLKALYRLTNKTIFLSTVERWEKYQKSILCRIKQIVHLIIFKIYSKLLKVD